MRLLFIVALLAGACATKPLQPGESALRRKCGGCHSTPTREAIKAQGLDVVLKNHDRRVRVNEADLRELRLYVEPPQQQ